MTQGVRFYYVLLVMSASILLMTSALSIYSSTTVRGSNVWVAHTHSVLQGLRSLESNIALTDAEYRQYLLAGDAQSLLAYQSGRELTMAQSVALAELVADANRRICI